MNKTYTNEDLSIQHPQSWQVIEENEEGTTLCNQSLNVLLHITSYTRSETSASLDKIVECMIIEYQEIYQNFQLLNKAYDMTINGCPSKAFSFLFVDENQDEMIMLKFYINANDTTMYSIMAMVPKSEKSEDAIKEIKSFIEIKLFNK